MDFTYIAWGSGEIVIRAFQALALLSLSPQLITSLAAAALAALLITSASAALSGNPQMIFVPARLPIVVAIVVGFLLVPSNVIVQDRFDGQELLQPGQANPARGDAVVNNVPVGVAAPASFASLLGAAITDMTETAMGIVDDEERLAASGLWLATRALGALSESRGEITDLRLEQDMRMFMENCTSFDLLNGRVDMRALVHQPVMRALANTDGGYTSVHVGIRGQGELQPASCPEAWNGNGNANPATGNVGLAVRLAQEGVSRQFSACQSLRGISLAVDEAARRRQQTAAATPEVQGALCGANVFDHALREFGYNGTVAEAFADVVAAELVGDYAYTLANQNPENVAFGKFSARRHRDATYVIAGELAATALPALRGLLEAVMIVLMPVLLIIGLLMFEQLGSYLKNGVLMLLWLQLWPPMIAVINAVGNWIQVIAVNEHSILSQGQFTIGSLGSLQSEIDVQLALSRYLLVVTPMLAYALVKSGEIGGAMLAGKLLMPGESAASSAAGSVAMNNWTADQVNLAPRTQVGAAAAQVRDAHGATATYFDQASVMALPSNEPGYLDARQTQSIAEEVRRSSAQAQTAASEHAQRFGSSVEAAYEHVLGSDGKEVLSSLRSNGVQDRTSFRALQAMSTSAQAAVAKAQTISDDETLSGQAQFRLSATADWMPIIGGGISGTEEAKTAISTAFRDSIQSQDSESIEALREVGTALEKSGRSELSFSADRTTSEGFRASQRETQRLEQSHQTAQQRADTLSKASQASASSMQSVARDLLRDPQAFQMLGAYHRMRNEQGLEHDQAWQEAQRQTGYRFNIDELAAQVAASMPELEPVERLDADASGQIEATAAKNQQRVADNAPAAPATGPQMQSVADQIAGHQRELQEAKLDEAEKLIDRERVISDDPYEQGAADEPANSLVVKAGGLLLEGTGEHAMRTMRAVIGLEQKRSSDRSDEEDNDGSK